MSIKITVQDTKDPTSYVCKRMRFWFRRNNLDYDDFKKNGIDLKVLKATGDQADKINALEATALRRIAKEN